jgi:hypothetical protein
MAMVINTAMVYNLAMFSFFVHDDASAFES